MPIPGQVRTISAGTCQHAFAEFEEALRLDPGYDYVYWLRASAYMGLGEYHQATRDLKEYISLASPNEPDSVDDVQLHFAYRDRALAYALLGMQAEARQDWVRQRELLPNQSSDTLKDYVEFQSQYLPCARCDGRMIPD